MKDNEKQWATEIDWKGLITRLEEMLSKEEQHYKWLGKFSKVPYSELIRQQCRDRMNHLSYRIQEYRTYYNRLTPKS